MGAMYIQSVPSLVLYLDFNNKSYNYIFFYLRVLALVLKNKGADYINLSCDTYEPKNCCGSFAEITIRLILAPHQPTALPQTCTEF